MNLVIDHIQYMFVLKDHQLNQNELRLGKFQVKNFFIPELIGVIIRSTVRNAAKFAILLKKINT